MIPSLLALLPLTASLLPGDGVDAPAAVAPADLPAADLPTGDRPAGDELPDYSTWTQWRGVARNGLVGGEGWPEALTEESVTQVWSVDGLGDSYATPLVARDRVFTVSTVDRKEEVAQAYDRKTGEKLWETRWEGAMKVPF